MLSKERVGLQLARLGTAFRRKIDARMVEVYWRRLTVHLDDEQLDRAVDLLLDDADRFPTIKDLLGTGRHRNRERGVPYVTDSQRQDIEPLSEYLSSLDSGRSPGAGDDQFRGRKDVSPRVERLVYEDAVVTTPVIQTDQLTDRLRRIANTAEAELFRLEKAPSSSAPGR